MNHSQFISNDVFPVLSFVLIGAAFFLVNWAFVTFHKNRITEAVRDLGAMPLSISWQPKLMGPRARHYKVRMQFPSGQAFSAVCLCTFFEGVYWRDMPWISSQQAGGMIASTCQNCGYGLQKDWQACPKCGRPLR